MEFNTIPLRLEHWRYHRPDRVAIRFLGARRDDSVEWTYRELSIAVRALAARLQGHRPGERALILLPGGPHFCVAFLASLYAGLIAVPVNVTGGRGARTMLSRVRPIVENCRPCVVLTSCDLVAPVSDDPSLAGTEIVGVDLDSVSSASSEIQLPVDGEAIAFLQYSSGSTGNPKGVMNSHRALLHQIQGLMDTWPSDDAIEFASWLPLYHDMGMIGSFLLPLTTGGTTNLLSPATFVERPVRWLEAISDYKANWIAGPDFGYDLCCHGVRPEELAGLDLSSLLIAVNGAEPIRIETLRAFDRQFQAAGLAPTVMTPAYGLAEAGLCVSISRKPRGWRARWYDVQALHRNVAHRVPEGEGRPLVACGDYLAQWRVEIVDPQTHEVVPPSHVGEIWISGPSAGSGYFGDPELSAATFEARLAHGEGPFVRTGDVGFMDDGELYVCGREKDLIILHGVNHWPNDLEASLERNVAEVRVGGVCAVQMLPSVEVVVLVEAERHLSEAQYAAFVGRIAEVLFGEHAISVDDIVLVPRRTLPKTSSGKIRRSTAARQLRSEELRVLYRRGSSRAGVSEPVSDVLERSLAVLLGLNSVDPDAGFTSLGLDSAKAVLWAHQISDAVGWQVPVTYLYRFSSLRTLSQALGDRITKTQALASKRTRADVGDGAVAIVGFGVRLPGDVDSYEAFEAWLLRGESAVAAPSGREGLGVALGRPGAYLADVDAFDAAFFEVAGAEAEVMDPQQRVLLETTWHAFEHAGIVPSRIRGTRTGVFIGQGHYDYATIPLRHGRLDWVGGHYAQGASMSSSAGRIAYHFDFHGPAMAIDTACSSSLVALDLAVRHVLDGTCELAVAGGVNLLLSPESEQALQAAGMLSKLGRCAVLSQDADGYVRGEGAVVAIIERLSVARERGHRVLAVIRSTAVAQDGRTSGLTVPNPAAQAQLMRMALDKANLDADDIDAIELHGTGTPIGDPIEVLGLSEAFGARQEKPLLLGSIKTQLGHLEAAAGLAGVLRAVAALRTQRWPGSPTFSSRNQELAHVPLQFVFCGPRECPTVDLRRVGVSSFGFNGTIAHAILEREDSTGGRSEVPWIGLVPLAARRREGLAVLARGLARRLERLDLGAQASILAAWRTRRDHNLPHRSYACATTPDELVEALRNHAPASEPVHARSFRGVSEVVLPHDERGLLRAVEAWTAGVTMIVPESVPAGGPETLDGLPLYPFEARRHWYPTGALASPNLGGSNTATPEAPLHTFAELSDAVATLLGCGRAELDENADLIARGLDSIMILGLAERLERGGVPVTVGALYETPTLRAWATCVAARASAIPWEPSAALVSIDESAPFLLTPVQHAYWVGRDPEQPLGGVACHVYAELDGRAVETERLERAVVRLQQRHGMLRARFTSDGRQSIGQDGTFSRLTVHDLSRASQAELEAGLERIRGDLSHRCLDVARGETFDVALSRLPGGATRLHFNIDMLVADALSIQIFLQDLTRFYARDEADPSPLTFSFPRYLAEQAAAQESARTSAREQWQRLLPDLPGAPELPLRCDPNTVRRPRFQRRQHWVDREGFARLEHAARTRGLTPSMVLCTAYAEVIAAFCGQPSFLLNLTLFNRRATHPDVAGLIADFTSVILLSMDCASAVSFAERVRSVQQQFGHRVSLSAYSGVEVLRDLARAGRGVGQGAPVVFTSNLGRSILDEESTRTFGELGFMVSQTPQVWLDHQVIEHAGGLLLCWDAIEALFAEGVLDAMFEAYRELVTALCTGAAAWDEAVGPVLPGRQSEVRRAVNSTVKQNASRLLHEPFFREAEQSPESLAVATERDHSSYAELSDLARRIATLLVEHGVTPGEHVAITMRRGPWQVAAILGTLFAGCVYVPIPVDQPFARRSTSYRKARVRVVLCDPEDLESSWPQDVHPIPWNAARDRAPSVRAVARRPEDPAYVIFTSGSTGEPKGVVVSHDAASNTIDDINARFAVTPGDRVLSVSSTGFDLSVYDLFGILGIGGAVILPDEEQRRDGSALWALSERFSVTLWNSVPALFELLLIDSERHRALPGALRLVLVSGDWVGLDLKPRLSVLDPHCHLIALGGATEAAIWSNTFEVFDIDPAWTSIPYGRPLANQCYRVVDVQGRDCPDWVVGELWIGGRGVALGYHGDAELTAARFVTDRAQRWYRTGDMGRYWPDGTLEFLGRRDQQVKVRGYRIELGEIEATLGAHPGLEDAVVLALGDRVKRLAAAVVPRLDLENDPTPHRHAGAFDTVEPGTPPANDEWHAAEAVFTEAFLVGMLGGPSRIEARPTAGELAARCGIADAYRFLFESWVEWLTERDVLQRSGESLLPGRRFDASVRSSLPELAEGRPFAPVGRRLVERLPYLLAILRGEADVVELLEDAVLSPEQLVLSRPETVTRAEVLAQRISELARRWRRPVAVCELGARSGGFSALLLDRIPSDALASYTLSDASTGLLADAKRRLGARERVSCRHQRGLRIQAELFRRHDIVVAHEALHRHPDVREILRIARCLLAAGGHLLAVESTQLSPLARLTVAVVERGFEALDHERRQRRSPLSSRATWHSGLVEAGFAETQTALLSGDTGRGAWIDAVEPTKTAADLSALPAWLSDRVPPYMVPEQIAIFSALPLSANGKIDRPRLRGWVEDAQSEDRAETFEAPRGGLERTVAEIWATLLGIPRVSRTANFFHLGGDSLIATRLAARLHGLGIHGASLPTLFAHPVLADFAATLTQDGAETTARVLAADEEHRHEPFPTTDVQYAYYLGRRGDMVLGGVGTHFYTEFDGAGVSLDRLEDALNTMIARHEMLRVVFAADGTQRILAEVPRFRIRTRQAEDTDAKIALAQLRDEMSHQVFDPLVWPLFDLRAVVYGDRVRFGISLDNIALDGLSMRILLAELAHVYAQRDIVLPSIRMSFRDYVLGRGNMEASKASSEAYWRERIATLPPAPELPLRAEPASVERPRFVRRSSTLPAQAWLRIKQRAKDNEVTPSSVLLTAYAEVLGAWSARQDLSLNLTLFDREDVHEDVHRVLGDFTSLLLVAYVPTKAETFTQAARRLQAQLWQDLAHRDVSAVWVLRELARRESAGAGMPVVFTSALGMDDEGSLAPPAAFPRAVWGVSQTPQVWLDHQVYEQAGQLVFNWDAVEALFSEDVLDAMFGAYCQLVERLANDAHAWEARGTSLIPESTRLVRDRVNATSRAFAPRLLHEAIFERALRGHDDLAIATAEEVKTFGALCDQARRIATLLIQQNVCPGEHVAITMRRGSAQIAAILGTLYAGAVYVPVGVDQPLAKRHLSYRKAEARIVLCEPEDLDGVAWPDGVTPVPWDAARLRPPAVQAVARCPEDPAYLIFTSGSTGDPKGVVVSHESAANTIDDINERFEVTANDRVLCVSSTGFDLSVYDIFGVLGVGGALILPEEDDRREASQLFALCERFSVSLWNSVPALFELLLIESERRGALPSALRLGLVSGDWVGLDLQPRIAKLDPACRLVALGGATEAAIWSNAFEVSHVDPTWRSIPYGWPLANQCYRVVDALGRDCPDYGVGELWIGGFGVALGYHGDPELTAQRFVTEGSQRWYRTGDMGRYWSDGTLEFLGRRDHQVKIRGYRIELGEIETALEAHPRVQDAVVVALGERSRKRLEAFVVAAGALEVEALRDFVAARVPEYAVPVAFTLLAEFPLTANGKVDRKRLAELGEQTGNESEPPKGSTEKALAEIWSGLLPTVTVGRRQNYFALGGDSILATHMMHEVEKRLGVTLTFRQLFATATIEQLARWIDNQTAQNRTSAHYEEGMI